MSRQEQVEQRGESIMPFDQRATTHVFTDLPDGGRQRVVAKRSADAEQVVLVRQHLRQEAAKFRRGDFEDPMAIHGMRMPGVARLRRGSGSIAVTYSVIPRGAQLDYRTSDPELVDALHDWFDAQLMDHGDNAHA